MMNSGAIPVLFQRNQVIPVLFRWNPVIPADSSAITGFRTESVGHCKVLPSGGINDGVECSPHSVPFELISSPCSINNKAVCKFHASLFKFLSPLSSVLISIRQCKLCVYIINTMKSFSYHDFKFIKYIQETK